MKREMNYEMNAFYIAYRNLKKNVSFYLLYFVSAAFVIAVFFSFTSFSKSRIILDKISSDGRVETMCSTISVFLMAFVIFYMAYSNRFFLRRRTKELGIYALLGYRKADILKLLISENIYICCLAFLFGILMGALAYRGIVCLINGLLRLGIRQSELSFLDPSAVAQTAVFVAAVLVILVISNGRFLWRSSLMDLVRFEKSAEKKMKFHKLPAAAGFLMILSGYGLSLDILRGSRSVWIRAGFYQTGLLTLFLVTAGTVLFIAFFLPYVMERSKRHKKSFYTDMKIVTTPGFIYRIRSNSRTLIMLTLLSAAVLTVSSVMALTLYYPIAAVSRVAPSEIEFRIGDGMREEDIIDLAERYAPDAADTEITITDLYRVTSDSDHLPVEYSLGSSMNGAQGEEILREAGFECISYSQYRRLLEEQGKNKAADRYAPLSGNECILLKYQPDEQEEPEAGRQYVLDFANGSAEVTVKELSLDNVISFANSVGTLVVSDELYSAISRGQTPDVRVASLNGSALKDNEALYQALSDYLDGSPYLQGHSHRINELIYMNSSTFLLIGFLVILFFIAAGSILYFNNRSAAEDSKADYEILEKIGYRRSKIRKIIRRQIRAFFAIPFLLGLADCIFASMVYKAGLMQNLLGSSWSQYVPVGIAVLLTALIYFVYYILTVKSCCATVWPLDRTMNCSAIGQNDELSTRI